MTMNEDRQEPREYDMFNTFACPEDVLESFEELQYKLEEVQCTCEEYVKKNGEWQQIVIDKERDHNNVVNQLREEINQLKKENLRISRERIINKDYVPPWFKKVANVIDQENKLRNLDFKINDLTVMLMEKDKRISSLEWDMKDSKATVTSLTADRNKLGMEVDETAFRLEELEMQNSLLRKNAAKHLSECIENSSGNSSYDEEQMSCSDRRSNRPDSQNLNEDDIEEGSLFGQLKRAANFSNINTLDESADFELDTDQMSILSGSGSSQIWTHEFAKVKEIQEGNQKGNQNTASMEDEEFQTTLSKNLYTLKWQSFENGSKIKNNKSIDEYKTKIHIEVEDSQSSPWLSPDSQNHNTNSYNSESKDTNLPFTLDSVEQLDFPKHEKINSFEDSFTGDEKYPDSCYTAHQNGNVENDLEKQVVNSGPKTDLWDFVPDSIIEVSTGKTLSTTDVTERLSPKPERKEDSDSLTSTSKRDKYSDHDTTNSKGSPQRKLVTMKRKSIDIKTVKLDRHCQRNRSGEKGKSNSDKEALEAYSQWKSQGKKGSPPVNFKVSLC